MWIVRTAVVLIVIALFVLLFTYMVTKNKKYLTVMMQLLKYVGWLAVILVLLNMIARVVRL